MLSPYVTAEAYVRLVSTMPASVLIQKSTFSFGAIQTTHAGHQMIRAGTDSWRKATDEVRFFKQRHSCKLTGNCKEHDLDQLSMVHNLRDHIDAGRGPHCNQSR